MASKTFVVFSRWVSLAFLVMLASCNLFHRTAKNDLFDMPPDAVEMPMVTITPPIKVFHGLDTMKFKLIHTRLDIEPNFKTRELYGVAELTLTPNVFPQDTLVLDARNFTFTNVGEYNGNACGSTENLEYKYDGKKLRIALHKIIYPTHRIIIRIEYIACPDAALVSEGKSVSKRGMHFITEDSLNKYDYFPQMWTQGETEYNCNWFPTIESTSQKSTYQIFLTVDSDMVTLSNGELAYSEKNDDGTRTDFWISDKPFAPYLVMVAAAKWKVYQDLWRDSIPVNYYLEPKYFPYAKMIFGNTPEMLTFFSNKLGYDYPWQKFSQLVAREFVAGAMENVSAVVHYEGLQHDARGHLDFTGEDYISHELFHQWFGDLVTCQSWSQLSMNESFATFGEYIWAEYKYGKQEESLKRANNLETYLVSSTYSDEAIIYPYYNDPEELFDRIRYEKGGLVLNMLRQELGDSIFFLGLKNYLHERAFKTTEADRLRMAMEETAGRDLKLFFQQWFFSPGHPDLRISFRYDSLGKKSIMTVLQLQKDGEIPLYNIPVKVGVYFGSSHKVYNIRLSKMRDSFMFDAPTPPSTIVFDEGKNIVCRKREIKTTQQWFEQLKHSPLYGDKREAIMALGEVWRELSTDTLTQILKLCIEDSFWAIRKLGINVFMLDEQSPTQKAVFEIYGDKIKRIALHDPKASVRNAAVYAIRIQLGKEANWLYKEAIKDSSYKVVATATSALEQYADYKTHEDTLALLKLLAPNESIDEDGEVILSTSKVLAKIGGEDKREYFHKNFYFLSGYYLSFYQSNYEKYLDRMSEDFVVDEVDFIINIKPRLKGSMGLITYKSMLKNLSDRLKRKHAYSPENLDNKFSKAISRLEQESNL
ncbi:MAG: M1 family aminopeptidase [Bacteroidetes bacterium]|nr:M1 family aminopeptidase [Bacteroidota bacterium]